MAFRPAEKSKKVMVVGGGPGGLEAAYKAAQQLYADESAKNPAFKKIYTEFDKYRKTQNAWFSVAEYRMDGFLQQHR